MRIAAIDFETATSLRSSACALGGVFATVGQDGSWSVDPDPFYELIRPPGNEFDGFNISIHGITPEMTASARPMSDVWSSFEQRGAADLVIAHNTAFDMSVLRQSHSDETSISPFEFACTYRLAKCTWPDLFSYRLDVLADEFGIDLGDNHHHAGYDAYAALLIAIEICRANGAGLREVIDKFGFRVGRIAGGMYEGFSNAAVRSGGRGPSVKFTTLVPSGAVDETHPVFGVAFSFTGTLSTMTRTEAAQLVVDFGGTATTSPTKKTRYLVVGVSDFSKVKDGASGKLKKALELAEAGTGIEIIDEAEFLQLF